MVAPLLARSLTTVAWLCMAASAQAGVVYEQPPLPGIDGIQADASTGAFSQTFSVAPGHTLDAIVWYGYHLPGSFGPTSDDFTVLVNGVDVSTGALSFNAAVVLSNAGLDLYRYVLDIDDIPLSSGTLELANGPDTQWAWQYSAAAAQLTAFTLLGPDRQVPEPGAAGLAVLALLACRRRRRA